VGAEIARIIYGMLFIVVIIFMPNGIMEFFPPAPADPAGRGGGSRIVMLQGEKITKRFGGLVAVSRLDFEIGKGRSWGSSAPTGRARRPSFNVISGLYTPEEGTLTFRGRRIEGRKPYEVSKMGIGRTFQIVKPLLTMTVLENIAIGAFTAGRARGT